MRATKFTAATMLAATITGSAIAGDTTTITFINFNDAESQLLGTGDGLEYGNAARFIEKLDELKAAAVNPVVISAGDNWLAGAERDASTATPGVDYDARTLGATGASAFCIGNHDFDFGPAALAEFIEDAAFTDEDVFISCNLDFSGEPALQALVESGRIAPSRVIEVEGRQVGIIGATTPNLSFISSPGNVTVDTDVVAAVQAEIDRLTNEGVEIIVLTSHLQGLAEDVALVAQLSGLDIAIAGGGDDLLANDDSLLIPGQSAAGPFPTLVADASGLDVPVISTAGTYEYLGYLVAEFDADGRLIGSLGGPVRVVAPAVGDDGVVGDAMIQKTVVDPVADFVAALASEVIGISETPLNGIREEIRSRETNVGDLVADSFRWQATVLAKQFGTPVPQLAIANGGGIRNDSIIPVGELTALDTYDMCPFGNIITVLPAVDRSVIVEMLENCYSRVFPGGGSGGGGTGRFGQISGATVVFNAARPAGSRLMEVALEDGTVIVSEGVTIPGPGVDFVTADFIANGGDEYPLEGLPRTLLGVNYQRALQNFIEVGLSGVVTAEEYPEGGTGRIHRVDSIADLSGDGRVDSEDLGIMFVNWGVCTEGESCLADLNFDGIVSGLDLGILVGSWSP